LLIDSYFDRGFCAFLGHLLPTSLAYALVAAWSAEYFLQVKKFSGTTIFQVGQMQQWSVCSVMALP